MHFFMHNWISFSTSSSVREVSVIASDFSVNYLSVLLGSTFNKKIKFVITISRQKAKKEKNTTYWNMEQKNSKFVFCVDTYFQINEGY